MSARSHTVLVLALFILAPLVLVSAMPPAERDALLAGTFVRSPDSPLTSIRTCDPWDGTPIPGAVHPSVLYFPEGKDGYKFWMVYTPYTAPYPERDWTWERPTLVRSNDGITWVKTDDYTNPLIGPGKEGSWEADYLADPDIVYTPDKGWFLYYAGAGPQQIGVATSSDGKHWTKYPGNPVVTDYPIRWWTRYTRTPAVLYDGKQFHMWYNMGMDDIGYATSDDGLHWEPYSDLPVVSPPVEGWDSASMNHLDVIWHDGKYWMFYMGSKVNYITSLSIGLATSPDGIHWTKYPGNPVLTMGTAEWESGCLYHPSPVVVGDEIWLYYTGMSNDVGNEGQIYEVGLAKVKLAR